MGFRMIDMPLWISAPLSVILAAFSCWMIASFLCYLVVSYLSKSWSETTASLRKVKTSIAPLARPVDGLGPPKDGYRKLKVEYEYTIGGRQYRGRTVTVRDLVGILLGGHNDNLFHQVRLALEKETLQTNVYVSKHRPVFSILFREETHWFAIASGILGCFSLFVSFKAWEFKTTTPLLATIILTALAYSVFILRQYGGSDRRPK